MASPPWVRLVLILLAGVAACHARPLFDGDAVIDETPQPLRPSVISCSTAGNYTDGSKYHVNLYRLLSVIPVAADSNGFFNGTFGAAGDEVFGMFMCYAGDTDSECQDCLARAPEGIMKVCPHSRTVRAVYNICLSRKHFAAACWQPIKCWRCFGDFHIASKCPQKSSSTSPSSGSRPAVETAPEVPMGSVSRLRSYAEVVLAPSPEARPGRPPDRHFPAPLFEQELLAAMMLAGPVDIDSRHDDPMLDEALALHPHVSPAVVCLVGCSAWCDEVWVAPAVSSVGSEEFDDPMFSEAMILLPGPDGSCKSIGEPLGLNAEHMMGAFSKHDVEVESQVEDSIGAVEVTQVEAPPTALEDFLSKVTCAVPVPLLGTPTPLHGEQDGGRRSGRLEKKNKACNIPTAKRAEHRLMEVFGELPEVSKVEGAEQKMKAYLDMYKKPLSPQTIAALSALVKYSAGNVRIRP